MNWSPPGGWAPIPSLTLGALLALVDPTGAEGGAASSESPPPSDQAPVPSSPGTSLFAKGAFHFIRLDVPAAGIESLRQRPREDVRADLRLGQHSYPQVALHLKGSAGSFRPVDDKPAMTLNFPAEQRCDGLRRIHLNNSVEDPSCLNEQLGGELFRAAGVPAPRVAHARVELNGRPLGLYVVKEGFTQDFLGGHFQRLDGNLYEPESGHDVDGEMKRQLGETAPSDQADRQQLAAALSEPDLVRRWPRLGAVLDTDRFLSFMALEVMLGHRDGYCLARNNFRLYHDPSSDKLVFLPHGMDQLLGTPDLPWRPHLAGLVARAVMDTPEGRRQYRERFTALFSQLFVVEAMTRRVDDSVASLRPFLGVSEFNDVGREAASLKQRIVQRADSLRRQLAEPDLSLIEFAAQRSPLAGWRAVDAFTAREMERIRDSEGRSILRIAAGQTTSASWRVNAILPRGKFRFEGRLKVSGVKPLPFGKAHGACLRVSGGGRADQRVAGDSPWQELGQSFAVESDIETVELVCELRASAGEAWFDADSLSVVRVSFGSPQRP